MKGGFELIYYNNNILLYPKLRTTKDDGIKEFEKIEAKYYRKNGKMYKSREY